MQDTSFRTPENPRKQFTVFPEGNRGLKFTVYHDEYEEDQTLKDVMSSSRHRFCNQSSKSLRCSGSERKVSRQWHHVIRSTTSQIKRTC